MKINAASSRYARALFEVATEAGKLEPYLNELRVIAEAFSKAPEFVQFFVSPTAPFSGKQTALKAAFENKVSADLFNLLMLLNDKGRMGLLIDVAAAFEALIDDSRGVSRGTVQSASSLDPDQRKKLEDTVNKVTGKQVILKFEVNPALAGGLVAQVGGWTFDDTLSSHLTALREDLNRVQNSNAGTTSSI